MKPVISDITKGNMRILSIEFSNGYGIQLICKNMNDTLNNRKWMIQISENENMIDCNKISCFKNVRNSVVKNCDHNTAMQLILEIQNLPIKGTFDIAI